MKKFKDGGIVSWPIPGNDVRRMFPLLFGERVKVMQTEEEKNESKENLLKEGDIIEITTGHEVYYELPMHFVYVNRVGNFKEIAKTEVRIGELKNGLDTDFLKGRYVVKATSCGGGGTGHGPGDVYPSGHLVKCIKLNKKDYDSEIEISFYQTGFFTAMIEDIKSVGRAVATWSEES